MKDILNAKIIARNRVNAAIKEMAPRFYEAIKPFVGKKVILSGGSGSMAVKFKEAVEPLMSSTPQLHVYREQSRYSLYFVFKTSESTGDYGCTYQESSLRIGDLKDGVLEKIYEFNPQYYRNDFTKEEIAGVREEIQKAKARITSLLSDLNGFGEYDT